MEITIYNCYDNIKQIQLFNTFLSNNEIKYDVVNNNNKLYLCYNIDETINRHNGFDILEF